MTAIYSGVATTVPVSMIPASNGNVYVVNGLTRGVVVVGGTTALPIGVTAGPTFSAASTAAPQYYFVSGVEVLEGGENYRWPPTVTITGVSGAKANLLGDSLSDVTITSSATTHTAAPALTLAAGAQATNASADPILRGQIGGIQVAGGAYYQTAPGVTISAATNVTTLRSAAARAVVTYATLGATSGPVTGIILTDPGLYEWHGTSLAAGDPAITAALASSPLLGSATLTVDAAAVVSSVAVAAAGSDYSSPPTVRIVPAGPTKRGDGSICLADLQGTTSVAAIDVIAGGSGYDGRATASLASDSAKAVATLAPRLSGKYLLGLRFVDKYGNPGDMCPLLEIDCKEKASTITWNLAGISLTDGSPNRLHSGGGLNATLELWRSSADQAITLYRVARLTATDLQALAGSKYSDGLPDHMLTDGLRADYAELAILTPQGYPYANRFGIPPTTMSVVTMFADRAWYAVDSSGAEPNAIYFSGVDELDSVPAENQIVIQGSGRESDAITGLMPMDGMLYVGMRRGIVRLAIGDDPLASASAVPVAQRGLLNDRCWDQFEGVAYLADSNGVYAFSGSSTEVLSDAVATYWTDPVIDFTKSKWFFLRVNTKERVVRFYFTKSADSYPKTALCYSLTTKAWWLEEYAVSVSCGVRANRNGQLTELLGSSSARIVTHGGSFDVTEGNAISYAIKTGNLPISTDPKRGVRLVFTPGGSAAKPTIGLRLYYNNSSSPRANAIASDLGTGVVTTTGSTEAIIDASASRSSLGTATGFVQVSFSGRLDDYSAGADRHLAIELAGDYGYAKSMPIIHRMDIEGVG